MTPRKNETMNLDPANEAIKVKAKSLQNGSKGDLGVMSEVLSVTALTVLEIKEKGWVTPSMCAETQKRKRPRWDWVAVYITTAVMFGGFLYKLLS